MIIGFCLVLFIQINPVIMSNYSNNACKINKTMEGKCIALRQCAAVVSGLKKGKRPILCSSDTQDEPLVCCPNVKTANTRISVTKCKEYTDAFIRTISVTPLLYEPSVTNISLKMCEKRVAQLIVGGLAAEPAEFPHMAAIGMLFDNELQWVCGGSIISERFILTAAHCREYNRVKPSLVRCGTLNLANPDPSYMDFKIDSIFSPPTYASRLKYDDIALIRVEGTIRFNKFIRPACLWPDASLAISSATATGWGLTSNRGQPSNELLKVKLDYFDNSVCNVSYADPASMRSLNRGIIESQLCAGDLSGKRDTCQGDSGSALQISLPGSPCTTYVVGITSFGRACGAVDSPSVYTRVSSYLNWLETLVWN